jgi:polyphosphate kinase
MTTSAEPQAPVLVPEVAAEPPAAPEQRYFNRELSWLAFNRRVLEEA